MSARDVDIKGNLLLYNFVAVLLGTEILSAVRSSGTLNCFLYYCMEYEISINDHSCSC
jgi:hypothetical protein